MHEQPPRFSSFFWAGFECTYAKNELRERIDMLRSSKHDEYCREDYHLIKELGIKTVREGLAWSQIDRGYGTYDFSRFESMMRIAQEEGVQQIWDLNHFDFPDDVSASSPEFVERFATYAQAAFRVLRRYQSETIYISPINEISFFAWIGGDRGVWAPYHKGEKRGEVFKKQLVRTSIAAMKSIWAQDSNVRFIHPDPFMYRLAKHPANEKALSHAETFNEHVRFDAWDMLAGKTSPELGGEPKYLDIVGVNYYFHNQEYVVSKGKNAIGHETMSWDDGNRIPLWQHLSIISERYQRPLVVSETGSYGDLRFRWWKRTLAEIDTGVRKGIPIYGVCSYPTVDRPSDVAYLEPQSGLWDFVRDDPDYNRVPHQRSLHLIRKYISRWI